MKRSKLVSALAVAAALIIAAPAGAAVTLDLETGTGFVGKGDVQTVFDWNNKQLQNNAAGVTFSYSASSETTWTCTKVVELGNGGTNEIVQQKSTETSTTGILSSVARENSKGKDGAVTGFHLLGWAGDPVVVTDGPEAGTCPADPSGFEFDDNAETTVSGGGLSATYGGVSHPLS